MSNASIVKGVIGKPAIALDLLLLGHTRNRVCAIMKISPRTLKSWVEREEFKKELQERVDELKSDNAVRIGCLFDKALTRVGKLLEHKDPYVVLKAATLLFKVIERRKPEPEAESQYETEIAQWSEAKLASEVERIRARIAQAPTDVEFE